MKILVLGASSFSGSWFCDVARAAGHEVVGLSRPRWDLNRPLAQQGLNDALESGYRHVVNYAALNVVAESWEHAPDYYRTNVVGIARLAKQLLGRVTRFVQVSTPEVYGTTFFPLAEDAPFRPSTPYAASRAAADVHLGLLYKQHGFPVSFTRTVNVYGPRQQLYRIVPKTALYALLGRKLMLDGGGHSWRSFLHSRDAAAATLAVLEHGRPGETYHAAHPKQVMIRNLVAAICMALDKRFEDIVENGPERPGKDMNYQLDDSKIRIELGWKEKIDLDDGLMEILSWIKAELPRLRDKSTEYRHVA